MNKEIIELIQPYMDKTLSEWCLIKTAFWSYHTLVTNKDFIIKAPYTETFIELNWQEKILWHYDITAVFDYINSINIWWVWPYYFDSISFSKEYYILTPTWDNDYARIPRKPLHLYTQEEETNLLKLLKKLWNQ